MASLVAVKRRMRIARNIAKTTRAMQMVAASKMRRAQDSATRGRAYAERLMQVVTNLTGRVEEDFPHPFLTKGGKQGKTLIVVFSPDKGLCGSLISNLKKELFYFHDGLADALYVTVGKKLGRSITGRILADFPMGTALPTFEQVPPLTNIIIEGFLKNQWSEVFVLYAKFLSVFSQKPTFDKLLPIQKHQENSPIGERYLFEPSAWEVLESLLPHYLESQLYQILLEAYASEQVARMLAMQSATDNANEIINILTLVYNKARQEKITNEILDVVRASSALLAI